MTMTSKRDALFRLGLLSAAILTYCPLVFTDEVPVVQPLHPAVLLPETVDADAPIGQISGRTSQPRPDFGPVSSALTSCKSSQTIVSGRKQCSGQLIFDTDFSNGLNRNWTRNAHFNDDESQFVVFLTDPEYSYVTNGMLTIKPTLLDTKYKEEENFTVHGKLDLRINCTSTSTDFCLTEAFGSQILPPVISARLSTDQYFSFCYGTVEVKAKLPRGDWIVPEIWLLPKTLNYGGNSGKIILGQSLGNRLLEHNEVKIGNNFFNAGLEVGKKLKMFSKIQTSGLWSDDFHKYKLIWRKNEIKFFLDDQEIGSWNGKEKFLADKSVLSPFDQEFYIVLGIHVGGDEDFPDDVKNNGHSKPWNNTELKRKLKFYLDRHNWYSTWDDHTKLQVEYIRVWAI